MQDNRTIVGDHKIKAVLKVYTWDILSWWSTNSKIIKQNSELTQRHFSVLEGDGI